MGPSVCRLHACSVNSVSQTSGTEVIVSLCHASSSTHASSFWSSKRRRTGSPEEPRASTQAGWSPSGKWELLAQALHTAQERCSQPETVATRLECRPCSCRPEIHRRSTQHKCTMANLRLLQHVWNADPVHVNVCHGHRRRCSLKRARQQDVLHNWCRCRRHDAWYG